MNGRYVVCVLSLVNIGEGGWKSSMRTVLAIAILLAAPLSSQTFSDNPAAAASFERTHAIDALCSPYGFDPADLDQAQGNPQSPAMPPQGPAAWLDHHPSLARHRSSPAVSPAGNSTSSTPPDVRRGSRLGCRRTLSHHRLLRHFRAQNPGTPTRGPITSTTLWRGFMDREWC
jgi:hypothetical protein